MTRQELVLTAIDRKKGSGLEIGPLTSPILSKQEANIFYADHMSQADLRQKYRDEPVELDKIAPVDFVVTDSLLQAVGKQRFDYVIACHVIEHIPNPVLWLQDIASIMKPGGILALAIPDKRYTFDIERYPSTAGDIIGAYLENYHRPPASAVYDFAAQARTIDSSEVWERPLRDWSSKKHRYSADEAMAMSRKNLVPGSYVDCHCLVFTPRSFLLVIKALMEQGLIDFEIASFWDTNDQNIEFYVSLRKLSAGHSEQKIKQQLASLPPLPKEASIPSLHAANLKLEDKTVRLSKQISALQKELETLHNSKSWKVTAPLRKVVKRLPNA